MGDNKELCIPDVNSMASNALPVPAPLEIHDSKTQINGESSGRRGKIMHSLHSRGRHWHVDKVCDLFTKHVIDP